MERVCKGHLLATHLPHIQHLRPVTVVPLATLQHHLLRQIVQQVQQLNLMGHVWKAVHHRHISEALLSFTQAMRQPTHPRPTVMDPAAHIRHPIICRSANKSCDKLNFCPPSSWEGGYFFNDYYFYFTPCLILLNGLRVWLQLVKWFL